MLRLRTRLATLCLLALVTTPAFAQAPSSDYSTAIERGRLIMQEIIQRAGVPGLSVAVGVRGEIVWTEGFGFADLEQQVPATADTKFRVGSVSKPITAAAVGLLVERGQLDLDAPVQRYVPSFPEKRWPITTRQLAGHIAGVRHYLGDETFINEHYDTVLDGLTIFQDDTLLFEPGTRFSYSSYGWNLISAVVESAAGEPFLQYMQANVFDPIGMHETTADHTDIIIPHRTRFYERMRPGALSLDRSAALINAPYVDNSYKWAGGGFIATTADLVRFGMAHVGDGFLAPEVKTLLWTSQQIADGSATGYGVGWVVGTDHYGRRTVSHGGSSVGGTAHLLLFPDDGVVVAILSNSSAPMTYGTAWAIAEPFLPPVPADMSYMNLSGTYACIYPFRNNPEQAATIQVLGQPDSYLVRLESRDMTADGLVAWSTGRALRAVLVEDGFFIGNLWLTATGDRATGNWNNYALTCERN